VPRAIERRAPDGAGVKLSVIVPARDEAANVTGTLAGICSALDAAEADFEIVVVDDGSTDATAGLVRAAHARDERVRLVTNPAPHGFGLAVRAGLGAALGDASVIVMADASDDPADIARYHALLEQGWDCVFGSRFAGGRRVSNYPLPRLLVNRTFNGLVQRLFKHGLDDTTNAFKAYRREVIEDVQPLVSCGFELTVELPLKAIARGYSFAVPPVSWSGRAAGVSKFAVLAIWRYPVVVAAALRERRRPAARRVRA
jgi:dolichol-phosphate mannosyltransferase